MWKRGVFRSGMNSLLVISCCFLVIYGSQLKDTKNSEHKIEKRSKVTAAWAILDFAISKTIDIASFINDKSRWAENEKLLKDIKNQLDHTTTRLAGIKKLLQELKKRLDYFDYDRVITDARRETSNCFDYVAPLYNISSYQQARAELETCNPRQKAYAKQIGDILIGKPIGTHSKLLFDQVIHDRGYCNGTEILNLREYLSVLFVEGCSVMIIAEYLTHENTTSFIDRNYCTRTLQEIKEYQETLFGRCTNESVDTRNKAFKGILSNAKTVEQAFLILNSTFPWFMFSLIKIECSEKCKWVPVGEENCTIQTFAGNSGEYYILMHYMRHSDIAENDAKFGIQIDRSCVLSEKSDGFSTNDLPIAAYYAFGNRPDWETCEKPETKCPGLISGTKTMRSSVVVFFIVAIIIVL